MPVKDVTFLRKEGRLDEALDLARRELEEDPNEWTCMSLFWVLRDLALNRFVPARDMEHARSCMEQMEKLLPDMMDDNGAGERACQSLCRLILPHAEEVRQASELSKSNPDEAYRSVTERFGTDAAQLDPKLHEEFGWIVYRYMKANGDRLTSVQIRRLLRDYMQLRNERPSLLHSVMLNYALSFAKGHSDFSFYRFFMLWGAENLRNEDYEEGEKDGHAIPSLTSRICKAVVESCEVFDVPAFVLRFDREDVIVEDLRQACFWRLMHLQKENKLEQLFRDFDCYAAHYAALGPSHWHSEILRLANRFMINENASRFVPFIMKWDGAGNLRDEDWAKETNDEGKEFQALAVKSAKKCFDVLKATPKDAIPDATLAWLKGVYETVMDNDPEDDWNVRNYARICVWCGEPGKAIALYKSLLLHMGEKFYLWAELASLITDDNELCIGLLLKAKRVERNEDFLGDIHLCLAALWQEEGFASVAQKELEAYAAHRTQKGWTVSERFRELQAKVVPGSGTSAKVDFNAYISKAEDYVYGDCDWVDFVITDKWVSENAERCNLYDGSKTNLRVKTKRFPILKKAKAGDVVQVRCNIVEVQQPDCISARLHRRGTVKQTKIIPLIVRTTGREPWSLLPLKYGVVDYVNEGKKVLHIITQDSRLVFSEYKGRPLPVNSFVKFREYEDTRKGETRICAKKVEPCSSGEALPSMPHCDAVVDGVNCAKELFHVVLGQGMASGVVRFGQTDIRPAVGDVLCVTYCIKKNKDGEKRVKFLDIQTSDKG